MEKQGDLDKEARYFQAKFLVHLYPEEAIDCLADGGGPDKIKDIVERRCHNIHLLYWEVIRLVKEGNLDELRRRKSASDASGGQAVTNRTSPSTASPPLNHTLPFVNAAFSAGGAHPPSPAPTSVTVKSQGFTHPPEIITIMGETSRPQLTMKPSNSLYSFIRGSVLSSRLHDVVTERCRALTVRHQYATGSQGLFVSIARAKLSFWRHDSPHAKSHEQVFYVVDNLEAADVLASYEIFQNPRVEVPPIHDVPGPPPDFNPSFPGHPSPQRVFSHVQKLPQDPTQDFVSDHLSSASGYPWQEHHHFGARHYGPHGAMRSPSQPESFSPDIPPWTSSRQPAVPPTANHQEQQPQAQPASASNATIPTPGPILSVPPSSKAFALYSIANRTTSGRFELEESGEQFLKDLKRALRLLTIPLDRSAFSVEFVAQNGASNAMSLDELSFQDEWVMAMEFMQNNRVEKKPEFEIKISRLDDTGVV